jgi:hypothetical protein
MESPFHAAKNIRRARTIARTMDKDKKNNKNKDKKNKNDEHMMNKNNCRNDEQEP